MSTLPLERDPRAAVSLLFAASLVPMVMLISMAIDVGVAASAKAQLDLAVDAAAMQGTRVASQTFINGGSSAAATGTTAAGQWWTAMSVTSKATVSAQSAVVSQSGSIFTANVSYTATVPTTFGGVFNVQTMTFSGAAASVVSLNAYTDVDMLIDNSGSMEIAADTTNVGYMETLTPCYIRGDLGPAASPAGSSNSGNNITTTSCTNLNAGAVLGTGSYSTTYGLVNNSVFTPIKASLKCGFACHWDSANTTDFYYGVAKNAAYLAAQHLTDSLGNAVTSINLRSDVVKSASQQVIQSMITQQTTTGVANLFATGLYTFGDIVTKVFPSSGESSTDLNTALTVPATITPIRNVNSSGQPDASGHTSFPAVMTSLASSLAAAGDGTSRASPRKNLFIISDGIQDYGARGLGKEEGPFYPASCDQIKTKGISIWVLYTTYTPLPSNGYYVGHVKPYVESPPTPAAVVTALQACASSPTQFYQANSPTDIATAMQTMLKAALNTPARLSQ